MENLFTVVAYVSIPIFLVFNIMILKIESIRRQANLWWLLFFLGAAFCISSFPFIFNHPNTTPLDIISSPMVSILLLIGSLLTITSLVTFWCSNGSNEWWCVKCQQAFHKFEITIIGDHCPVCGTMGTWRKEQVKCQKKRHGMILDHGPYVRERLCRKCGSPPVLTN